MFYYTPSFSSSQEKDHAEFQIFCERMQHINFREYVYSCLYFSISKIFYAFNRGVFLASFQLSDNAVEKQHEIFCDKKLHKNSLFLQEENAQLFLFERKSCKKKQRTCSSIAGFFRRTLISLYYRERRARKLLSYGCITRAVTFGGIRKFSKHPRQRRAEVLSPGALGNMTNPVFHADFFDKLKKRDSEVSLSLFIYMRRSLHSRA